MNILWTSHLSNNPKEKKELEDAIKNSNITLDRLRDIYTDKKKALDLREYSSSTYKEAGWPFQQAHDNGKRCAYNELLQLLTMDDPS